MTDLFTYRPDQKFSGKTFSEKIDGPRLQRQLDRVRSLMEDGEFRTLTEISEKVPGSITALSARLRDLRCKENRTVLKERVSGGLWKYRLVPKSVQSESERASLGLRSTNSGDVAA